ncbi:TPA: phage tail protein [Escherichia coli]|nr:phage tail protein [Escherichia coli]HBA7645378.1 phage tail protein [Escherichia coli]HBA7654486.1 phage tail protein [Escherichia coli]HBA7727722.1 phage tail protein [Escherichia coli]HBA7730832.1 phage tail protein [Escherichia coli]
MAVKISGVLKDGTGKPIQNCTIRLKARRNSTTVVVNTLASENPDEAGRYSMDVEYGQYSVILLVEGFPPSHAGTITVYEDSKPGSLNDFLGAATEADVQPEALRRFEWMVEEVARNAAAVAKDTAEVKTQADSVQQNTNAVTENTQRVERLASEVAGHAEQVKQGVIDVAEAVKVTRQAARDSASSAANSKASADNAAGSAQQTAQDVTATNVARDDAESAARTAREFVENPLIIVPDAAALPELPHGLYLVENDESKGGGPQIYYYPGDGRRFWFASVEDTQ